MKLYEVTVNGRVYRIKTSTPGEAAKVGVGFYIGNRKTTEALALTVNVLETPKVQDVTPEAESGDPALFAGGVHAGRQRGE